MTCSMRFDAARALTWDNAWPVQIAPPNNVKELRHSIRKNYAR